MKEGKQLLAQFLQQNEVIAREFAQNPAYDIYQLWPLVLRQCGLEILAGHSQVLSFEREHLRLAVRHSVFLQELKLHQEKWAAALEQALRQHSGAVCRIGTISYKVQQLPEL